MKREETVQQNKISTKLINTTMTSAVTRPETNPSDGYFNAPGAYYHQNHQPPPFGHPPMQVSYPTGQPNPPHVRPYYPHHADGYSTGVQQYMPDPSGGYGAPHPAPMPPPQQHAYHHPAPPQHQMYYGSWSSSVPPGSMGQQMYYVTYPILPPEAQNRRRSSRKHQNNIEPEPYGALELGVFDIENDNLASALNFVKRNSKATLFDIDGIIADVATADEPASRFVQKRLKLGSPEERLVGLKVALSSLDELWSDHYGNFMLQGIFEFGTADMKKDLMDAIYCGDVVALCLHMHGCRVIQKAIRCLEQEDVSKLIKEFHDKVITFTHDPNGNHVIQRSIQVMSSFAKEAADSGDPDLASSLSDQMQFIIDDIVANAEALSTHRYGCRVVQRAIEHCVDEQKNAVLETLVSCHENLVVDQYGNYVVQQVLACGTEAHQAAILKTLTHNGALLTLSKHKYASNVVEAVLMHGKPHHKEQILEEMLTDTRKDHVGGYCCAIELSKDPIANYVVKKAIEVSEDEQKEKLFQLISASRPELAKSPYAKYVLQRIDKHEKSLDKQEKSNDKE